LTKLPHGQAWFTNPQFLNADKNQDLRIKLILTFSFLQSYFSFRQFTTCSLCWPQGSKSSGPESDAPLHPPSSHLPFTSVCSSLESTALLCLTLAVLGHLCLPCCHTPFK
jgi:hypothetical protein